MSKRIVFLDTETTGLDRNHHEPWEIGMVIRDPESLARLGVPDPEKDHEISVKIRPNLQCADPNGLRIGRFYDRIGTLLSADPGAWVQDHTTIPMFAGGLNRVRRGPKSLGLLLAMLLDESTIVGAVPWFDTGMLEDFLHPLDLKPTWHYHLVDVETLAAGATGMQPPWHFDELLRHFGLCYDEQARHTALGDARMARDLYDRVLGIDGTVSADPATPPERGQGDGDGQGDEPGPRTIAARQLGEEIAAMLLLS